MENIHILKLFHYRQVVINIYENDELMDRNGFDFDTIQIDANQIQFIKENAQIYALPLNDQVKFSSSGQFKNHYVLTQGDPATRTEIYFP